MSDIETRLFRYFVAVAEEQHFARAALRLRISPPTLTYQIKKLESQLGAKLLERKGNRQVVVTEAGQRFLARAREVLRQVEEAAAIARQAGRGELGRLELGFVISVSCAGLLRSWIGAFQQINPAIDITIHKLAPIAQITGILRKELDGGFTRTPLKYPSGVRGFEVYRQPLVLALPSEHPLVRRENISPAMLAREAFISTTTELDLGFSGHTETIARIGSFIPRVVKREDDFIAVLAYVALGRGIAVVPEIVKTMKLSNVVFRHIAADPIPQTSIAFVYGSAPSPSANLMIRHMQRHALRNRGRNAAPPHSQDRVMSIARRKFLILSFGAAALPIVPPAVADTFPSRPVRIVDGFPAGNIGDIAARLIAQPLQERLGQSVIVENRPGAGGNVGTETVVNARPDGGTLILAGSRNAIDATLYKTLPFNFIRDIAMVGGIMQGPLVLVAHPAFPAKNVAELIDYANANPGKIDMASGGNGTITHLAGALFQMMAGLSMVHVPYRGGAAALTDLVAGRTQLLFSTPPTSISFIRDGRLRALAVTSLKASPVLPGIPPLASVIPGYEVSAWFGLGAPKATPQGTIAILNKSVNACLAEPAIADRMRELGAEPMIMSPGELDAFVVADTERWAGAVKFSGAKVD